MISKDVIRKIKHLEIYTRRLLSGMQVGDYSTAQKGAGFEFDRLTEYQHGDDVRFIDWKATARSNSFLVRRYLEERNRTILLFVDVSSSGFYSSGKLLRDEILCKVAGVIALVGDYGKDRVGLVLFSNEVKLVVSPGKGRKHIHTIMQKLFSFEYRSSTEKTDLNIPFSYLACLRGKKTLSFVISDFIGNDFEKSLRVAQKKDEIVAIRYLDKNERSLPNVGFLRIKDIETSQKSFEIKTNGANKNCLKVFFDDRVKQQDLLFKKYAIDLLDIRDNKSFVSEVVKFFRRRMRY